MVSRAFRSSGIRRHRPRRLSLLLAAALHLPALAALDPAAQVQAQPTLADYLHTRWNVDDGAPPAILAMAQTTDGWLWLGTWMVSTVSTACASRAIR